MTLNVTLSDVISMSDEIPDVIVCHVQNDRMGAHEKNLTIPRDRTHRNVFKPIIAILIMPVFRHVDDIEHDTGHKCRYSMTYVSDVSAYNDITSGCDKNLITPHDTSRRNILQSDDINPQSVGFQAQ